MVNNTLYDIVQNSECDYDTYDTVYDAVITVCWIEKESDYYDKFCNGIIKFVDVIKYGNDTLTCNWSDMIERNIKVFRDFADKYWGYSYEDDDDEFIYQWLEELDAYMAGYVSEDIYRDFVTNYMNKMI